MSHPGPLLPPYLYVNPINRRFLPAYRKWVCAPSIEKTRGGRLFMTCTSGSDGENNGTYALVSRSDDGGNSWIDPCLIAEHPLCDCRVFDSVLWIDPLGRLWLYFSQAHGRYDDRFGVWAMVCENPDADTLMFSPPRRFANGIMKNKPTVLRDGRWLFACPLMGEVAPFYKGCPLPTERHPELDGERLLNVYVSQDEGETYARLGAGDFLNPTQRDFDEPMIVERADGTLWMLSRTSYGIGESFSTDGGRTWTLNADSGIPSPSARFFIRRLRSGNLLLVNHYRFTGRNNLAARLSRDDGKTWEGCLYLDTRDRVTYPDGIQDENGLIYITYDHQRYVDREIMLTAFREEDILAEKYCSKDAFLPRVISKGLNQ